LSNISLITEIPGPKARELLALRDKYVPGGVSTSTPLFAVRARGALIEDIDGNTFIDFAGGIGVQNVGHNRDEVVVAVIEQADRFLHTCFQVVMYEPYVRLAEKLARTAPGDEPKKVMFVNSGAEAVENAVKIARKYTGRSAVVTFENSFHGRTLLALSLTSKVKPYKWGFGPFAPEIYRVPSAYCYRCTFGQKYPGCGLACVEHLEKPIQVDVGADQLAAVILEPVQGEGGFIDFPDEFVREVRRITEKYGALLIADEVQTGFGRTGKMFCVEHYGVTPDLITVAKSLAAGLPLAGVVGKAEIMDAVHAGGVGGTYGGNPLACAAALKVLELMERDRISDRAQAIGKAVHDRFLKFRDRYALVGDVRGKGAMVAMELVTDRRTREPASEETARMITWCYEHGLIALKAGVLGNVIRFLAPLVISNEELAEGLDILEEALGAVSGAAVSAAD